MAPDVVTCNAWISACAQGARPELALEFFATVRQQGTVPNVLAYNVLISACERGSQPLQALELFAAMREIKQWHQT